MKISPRPRSSTRSSSIASTSSAHGDVERRGRLVGDQDVGLGDEHHGDHDALAHAARDLVRIEPRRRARGSRILTVRSMSSVRCAPRPRRPSVHGDRLPRSARRPCITGFSEYFGSCMIIDDAPAADLRASRRSLAARRSVLAEGAARSRRHPRRARREAQDGAAGHGSCRSRTRRRCRASRARASKDTPRTASTGPCGRAEGDAQVARPSGAGSSTRSCRDRARRAGRRRARLKARLTTRMAMPGKVATHQLSSMKRRPDGDHRAPFGRRRLRAEAEEAEARRGQDDARHVERHAHDRPRAGTAARCGAARCARRRRPGAASRRCSRSLRRLSVSARASRAIGGQAVSEMAMIAFSMPGPSAATKASASTSPGRRGRCR